MYRIDVIRLESYIEPLIDSLEPDLEDLRSRVFEVQASGQEHLTLYFTNLKKKEIS